MAHHHEQPDEIKDVLEGIRSYWTQKPVYQYLTDILELNENWIRLHKNHFYPEGGGQMPDRGVLKRQDDSFDVIDVQIRDNDTWIRVREHTLSPGDRVSVSIDRQYREKLSRNHSSQHLLSAVFWEELENETTRAEITSNLGTVELENTPSADDIIQALQLTNELIETDLPIESMYFDSTDNMDKMNLRGGYGDQQDIYRVVKIGNYDLNLCGGTHVLSTAALGHIHLERVEGRKIRFKSGMEARNAAQSASLALQQISRIMGTNVDKVLNEVEILLSNQKQQFKELRNTRVELLKLELLSNPWIISDDFRYKFVDSVDLEKGKILGVIGTLNDEEVILVLNISGLLLITSADDALTSMILNKLKSIGVKGGGRGRSLLGKVSGDLKSFKEKLFSLL